VAIVGAGIAGVSTAYYLLRDTDLDVLLLDAGRIAHGATGHNAGQVVSYFERPLTEMVEEFGLTMAMQGQDAIESAWELLEDITRECGLTTPLYRCTGYAGLSTLEQILTHLENNRLRAEAGLHPEPVMMRVDEKLKKEIPEAYRPFLFEMPHSSLLKLLETDDPEYIATLHSRKGCMNSAQFCEELVVHMTNAFGDRFTIAENLPVTEVTLRKTNAVLKTHGPTVTAEHVVLCTNGFETLTLDNHAGKPIDAAFHDDVRGLIGYMAGYLQPLDKPPAAISYFRAHAEFGAYNYVTRRPYEHPRGTARNLVCLGGPERPLPNRATYHPRSPFPADIEEEMDRFLRITRPEDMQTMQRTFLWHGLMGYTPNGVRRIGCEPKNPRLLYNLGCNGVGILPSIYGGKRISRILAGQHVPASIFDPRG
jgi:glycine/D-amino acid oxidase-like deaminating enzyme